MDTLCIFVDLYGSGIQGLNDEKTVTVDYIITDDCF